MLKLVVLALVVSLGSFFVPAIALAQRSKCNIINRGSFDNLQAAVDAAMDGDTLRVQGTCYGTTTISEVVEEFTHSSGRL